MVVSPISWRICTCKSQCELNNKIMQPKWIFVFLALLSCERGKESVHFLTNDSHKYWFLKKRGEITYTNIVLPSYKFKTDGVFEEYDYYILNDSFALITDEGDQVFTKKEWSFKGDSILELYEHPYKVMLLNKDTLQLYNLDNKEHLLLVNCP